MVKQFVISSVQGDKVCGAIEILNEHSIKKDCYAYKDVKFDKSKRAELWQKELSSLLVM